MAHKTLVGGTAYEISGGKALVDGTAYSIKNGKTLVDGTGYEIGFGGTVGDLAVGSAVFVGGHEFIVVHQGLPGAMYDSSCNGTWLLKKTPYDYVYGSTTWSVAYGDGLHTELSNFFNTLDTTIQGIIKKVRIPYTFGNNWTLYEGSSGLYSDAFALSCIEVGFSGDDLDIGFGREQANREGAVLDYFNGCDDSARILKNDSGNNHRAWWLRSPVTSGNTTAWCVSTSGTAKTDKRTNSNYIRPAIILPSDAEIDENLNVIA